MTQEWLVSTEASPFHYTKKPRSRCWYNFYSCFLLLTALLLLCKSLCVFVHRCVIRESVSVLLSAHLPSSPIVQRWPNGEHHVAEIRFINESSCCSQQFLQLLAACCLIFYTYPILITLLCGLSPRTGHWLESQSAPLPPRSLSLVQQAVWSFRRSRQTWPRATRKEREKRRKKAFQSMSSFFKKHNKRWPKQRSSL